MEFLRGGQLAHGVPDAIRCEARLPNDEIEEALRVFGYNRREREQLRCGRPRSGSGALHAGVPAKRYQYYISKRCPELPQERAEALAREWTAITGDDLDLALRWWDGGIDPQSPQQFIGAIQAGLTIEHLASRVGGKTVAEHLNAGNSLRWCMGAIGLPAAIHLHHIQPTRLARAVT